MYISANVLLSSRLHHHCVVISQSDLAKIRFFMLSYSLHFPLPKSPFLVFVFNEVTEYKLNLWHKEGKIVAYHLRQDVRTLLWEWVCRDISSDFPLWANGNNFFAWKESLGWMHFWEGNFLRGVYSWMSTFLSVHKWVTNGTKNSSKDFPTSSRFFRGQPNPRTSK